MIAVSYRIIFNDGFQHVDNVSERRSQSVRLPPTVLYDMKPVELRYSFDGC